MLSPKQVASHWKQITAALAAMAIAVIGYATAVIKAKTDELEQGRDPRDRDIIRLMDKVDALGETLTQHRLDEAREAAQLRQDLELAKATISWMKTRLRATSTAAGLPAEAPPALASATFEEPIILPVTVKAPVEDLPVDEERLKVYQQTRK